MAVTSSDIVLSVVMNTSGTPPSVTLTDATNYSTYGVTPSWVLGYFIVTGPAGTFYQNASANTGTPFATPDIDGGIPTLSKVIPLPLDTNGRVVTGLYTIQYSVGVFEPAAPQYVVNVTKTVTLTIAPPIITISQDSDCWCPTFVSKDITNYNVAGATIVSITSVHTVVYPISTATQQPVQPDVVSSLPIITIPELYTGGSYISTVETTVVYQLPDGTIVMYDLFGQKTKTVTCDFDICSIKACIGNLVTKYRAELCTNPIEAQKTGHTLLTLSGLLWRMDLERGCGSNNNNAVSETVCSIKTILGETTGCGCGENDTIQDVKKVGGFCGQGTGSGFTALTTSGNGIVLTPITGGFQLSLDTTLVGAIAQSAMSNTITVIQNDITALQSAVSSIVSSKYIQLYNSYSIVTNANASVNDPMKTFTIPAGTLANNGDRIVITTTVLRGRPVSSVNFPNASTVKLLLNALTTANIWLPANGQITGTTIKVTITRTSATNVRGKIESSNINSTLGITNTGYFDTSMALGTPGTFTPYDIALTLSSPISVTVTGNDNTANNMANTFLTVELFKA